MLGYGEMGEIVEPGTVLLLFSGAGVVTQVIFSLLLPDCRRMVAPREANGQKKEEAAPSKP